MDHPGTNQSPGRLSGSWQIPSQDRCANAVEVHPLPGFTPESIAALNLSHRSGRQASYRLRRTAHLDFHLGQRHRSRLTILANIWRAINRKLWGLISRKPLTTSCAIYSRQTSREARRQLTLPSQAQAGSPTPAGDTPGPIPLAPRTACRPSCKHSCSPVRDPAMTPDLHT